MSHHRNGEPREPDHGLAIRELCPDDVPRLRLNGLGRVDERTVRKAVEAYPGRSVWAPNSLEFALVVPWRHREEIAVVQELSAARGAGALVAAAVECCRAAGTALLLFVELDERRRASFYDRAHLSPIEDVITYELEHPRSVPAVPGPLVFESVVPGDSRGMEALVRLDHAAFPWLWWNSAPEFAVYAETPGVELILARIDGRPAAYIGITSYADWGHLDRIAVDPAVQGRGLGAQALAFAVEAMVRRGAKRVALSTQRENERSQRLYERYGFRRSPGHDYRLYGAALFPPAPGLATGELAEAAIGDVVPAPTTTEG